MTMPSISIADIANTVVICLILSYVVLQTSRLSNKSKVNFSSSMWCRGSADQHTTRLCHFENLCFSPAAGEYVFFHGPHSVVSGHPRSTVRANDTQRLYRPLTVLTSVLDMNTMSFDLTWLPTEAQHRLNITFIRGHTYLFNRFKPDNLMHVFHDDLLPIYATLRELSRAHSRTFHLAFLDGRHYQRFHFLYRLLTEQNVITDSDLNPDYIYCWDEADVGVNRDTVWYDYGFTQPQRSLFGTKTISRNTIRAFTTYIRQQLGLNEDTMCKNAGNYSVLILRRHTRLILNAEELIQVLVDSTGWQVKVLIEDDFGSKNFDHVVETISCSSMMVAMHGAALVLALFLRPLSSIVELFPFGVNPEHYTPYKTLAEINELFYSSWVNRVETNSRTHPDRPPDLGGLRHLSDEEQASIMSSTTVEPHLCCNDARWLFRIYQDTWVDLHSFSTVLNIIISRDKPQQRTGHQSELVPGPVRNVRCGQISERSFNLSWETPWNVQFLERKDYQYEIWIEEKKSQKMKSVLTAHTHLLIPKSASKQFHCWVNVYQSLNKMIWTSCS